MYAKIEVERLLFIRLNQKSLRSKEYIYLQNAIANGGKVTIIGQRKKNYASQKKFFIL